MFGAILYNRFLAGRYVGHVPFPPRSPGIDPSLPPSAPPVTQSPHSPRAPAPMSAARLARAGYARTIADYAGPATVAAGENGTRAKMGYWLLDCIL